MIVIISIVYILIGVIEWVPMLKNREKGVFLYGFLLIGAFTISILLGLDIKIPSPAHGIEAIFSTLLGWR